MPQASIPLGSVHEQQKWSDNLMREYLNGNQFRPFMRFGELRNSSAGDAAGGVIAVMDALGKHAGTKVNIPLRRALAGVGVVGDQTLEGNEEELVFDNESITVDLFRHGVKIFNAVMTDQRTAFDYWSEARPALLEWSEERLNQEIIDSMADISRGRVQNRYLYGIAESNWNATHATALGNVDTTNDQLTVALIKKLKDKAKATPTAGSGIGRIRPARMTMDNGMMKKSYVLFIGTRARRSLEADPTFQNIQFNAQRESGTPVLVDTSNFVGVVDGVIVYEIEGFPEYTGVGTAAADVGLVALSGAQSVAIVYGQRPWFTQQEKDYGAQKGIAINEVRDVQKLVYNGANYGMINAYVALPIA